MFSSLDLWLARLRILLFRRKYAAVLKMIGENLSAYDYFDAISKSDECQETDRSLTLSHLGDIVESRKADWKDLVEESKVNEALRQKYHAVHSGNLRPGDVTRFDLQMSNDISEISDFAALRVAHKNLR
ncbi:MAG: hypothetical protein ACRBBQ_03970 [Cognatishimia sp.]